MVKKRLIGGIVVVLLITFGLVLHFRAEEPVDDPLVSPEPIEASLPNPYVEKLLADYETEVIDLLNQTKTPGLAIAVVQDSTILFMKTYGVRKTGSRDSVNI